MERGKKAIHLRTGDRETGHAISCWLERYGVEVIDFADPFEACTWALTQPEMTPDLAFVGADWLAPDELAIVGYFRETWPGLATVVYGSAGATAGFQAAPLTLVCRSASAVQRILADPPAALLKKLPELLRSHVPPDDGWRPQPKAPPPDERRAEARETSRPCSTVETKGVEQPSTELTPRVARQDADGSAATPTSSSQTILTREELAALLEDNDR